MANTFGVQMYNANKLASSLVQLGEWLREEAPLNDGILRTAEAQNPWFTRDSVVRALNAHGQALSAEGVAAWTADKVLPEGASGKKLGLVLAGNLPLVGLSDIVAGVMAGHEVHVKPSSDDAVLPRWVVTQWATFEPHVAKAVVFHDGMMKGMDAMVATGGNNASRYFETYFGDLPHLFRGQRTSVAWLDGNETDEELCALGDDVFAHFGLGCRSVTKLMIPRDFDLDRCFGQWLHWGHVANHAKYANNYDYHKAVWLLNQESLIENGFLLVKEDPGLFSPLGTLFVERYDAETDVLDALHAQAAQIQVVTVREAHPGRSLLEARGLRVAGMGSNQCPTLTDHADGVDTLAFLLALS